MITVDPMPHEPAIAHAGRIAFVKGWVNNAEFGERLAEEVKRRGGNPISMPRLNQLALVSNMSTTDYARQHSMLSALRVAARTGEDLVHGAPESATFTRRLGMLTQRQGAYVCIDCVKEDLAPPWHHSWFRRTHHLLGVDWCPTHRTRLSRVTACEPWNSLPQHWLESGDVEPLKVCCSVLDESSFLARYVDIACALLERPKPFDTRVISEIIARRTKSLGLRSGRQGVRPLLSDRVKHAAPAEWLSQHFPELHQKHEGVFHSKLDDLVASRTVPRTGFTYSLVLAALFDKVEDAMHNLQHEADPALRTAPMKVRAQKSRGKTFWYGEFWDIYLQCDGRPKLIEQRLQMDRKTLYEKMQLLGLPALHDVRGSPKWRALARFHGGESLVRACAQEGVEMSVLEHMLRLTSAKVASMVIKVIGPIGGCDSQAISKIDHSRQVHVESKSNRPEVSPTLV